MEKDTYDERRLIINIYCDPRHESRKYFQCPYYQEKEQGISDLKKGFVGGVKNDMRATVLIYGSFIAICVFGWLYMTVRSHLGLSKTHAVYTLAPSEGCTVDTSEIELRLVPRDEKGEEYSAFFDENNSCTFDVKVGTYDMYLVYDGVEFRYMQADVDGISDWTQEISLDNMFFPYVLVCNFYDESGQEVTPKQVDVYGADGTESALDGAGDGSYLFYLNGSVWDWTVHVDGYKEVEMSIDMEGERIGHMSVLLHPAS